MNSKSFFISGACVLFVLALRAFAQTQYPFQNPELPLAGPKSASGKTRV